MKRALVTAVAVTLLAAGISFAVDHSEMHEMMWGVDGVVRPLVWYQKMIDKEVFDKVY